MNFVFPGFLWALTLLSIPVLIHLFNFRRFKKILFTNVRFLDEVKKDTQSRNKLKHILILISRLLAVFFLVMAFAQPFIKKENSAAISGQKGVSIYIDNSFSMEADGSEGQMIENAKAKAREIVKSYKASDKFQIITNEFNGISHRLLNAEDALQEIDRVKVNAPVKNISEVLILQKEQFNSFNQASEKILYEISDFQKSISDFDNIKTDSGYRVQLLPIENTARNNVSIDSAWLNVPFVQPGVNNSFIVKITNHGKSAVEGVQVKLLMNNLQKALGTVNINEGETVIDTLTFTTNETGWMQCIVELTDYPVTFDDKYFSTFYVEPSLKILSVNDAASKNYISKVYGNDPYFILQNTDAKQLDYASFSRYNIIVVNSVNDVSSGLALELKKYADAGGYVIIFPGKDSKPAQLESFLNQIFSVKVDAMISSEEKVKSIETNHPLLSDVFENKNRKETNLDLPVVKKYFPMKTATRSNTDEVMILTNSLPFLINVKTGAGSVFVYSSPLDEECNNFMRHALFVPIMIKSVLMSAAHPNQSCIIGRDNKILLSDSLNKNERVLHLINQQNKFDIIPPSRALDHQTSVAFNNEVNIADIYELKGNDQLLTMIPFNYDRRESDLSAWTPSELKNIMIDKKINMAVLDATSKTLSASIKQSGEGIQLWKYCILLTLLFLLIEILLIRFYKS